MLYLLGLRENTKTEKLKDKDGKYVIDGEGSAKKAREVITSGGELVERKEINKIVRDVTNFLYTIQRKWH